MRSSTIGAILILALILPVTAQQTARPARMGTHPNFNGIWQTLNTAYWDLEAHNAKPLDEFWKMGAIAAIPAGKYGYTPSGLQRTQSSNTTDRPMVTTALKPSFTQVSRFLA